jgi:hypothetical protein
MRYVENLEYWTRSTYLFMTIKNQEKLSIVIAHRERELDDNRDLTNLSDLPPLKSKNPRRY